MISMEAKLGIFDTFKTKKEELTGEAIRQRAIITSLATENNPSQRTRTAIAQRIAQENGTVWKNIYSGIFRDLDEILIPLNIVEEAGRLPLKRGPKALQEKGIPFYQLTQRGLLISVSLDEIIGREKILERFFAEAKIDGGFAEQIQTMSKFAPRFVYSLFRNYVKAYCDGKFSDLMPFERAKFMSISDEAVLIQKEFLESFIEMPKNDKEKTLEFLKEMG
ncbi:MAG: hypothetical protein EB150_06635 [Nitrososphaeria archaeon]|nr:hypothetical protein [Nitrososphaeria archaeon]NDB51056.1 hypothetical protein [Nitrosopumilaceae archaeon]NDB87803.1 hypothetical protein [Nitrososphaerota archaeon]NDB46443.1 hypothetical protein [Nitrososphaeria archaeon]NDB62703.1 hypothetical protein [Nitrosopumilaceae archaeon]